MPLPDFSHPEIIAAISALLLIVGAALTVGGWPERCVAATFVAMFGLQSALYGYFGRPVYESVDWIALSSDLLGFALIYAISANAERLWPLIAAMFQLISVLAHFARSASDILGISYSQLKSFPTLVVLALLAVGVITHRYRLWRDGEDRDWTDWQGLSKIRAIIDHKS